MTDQEERTQVAQGLCKKDGFNDGRNWETIDQIMRNAYLHNADTEISRVEEKVEAKKVEESGVPICDLCKGAMYVNGEPCRECNPVGLPKEKGDNLAALEVLEAKNEDPKPHKHFYRKDGFCACGHERKSKKSSKSK